MFPESNGANHRCWLARISEDLIAIITNTGIACALYRGCQYELGVSVPAPFTPICLLPQPKWERSPEFLMREGFVVK